MREGLANSLARRIGYWWPKKEKTLSEILDLITSDPLLLEKVCCKIQIKLIDPMGKIISEHGTEGIIIELQCSDQPSLQNRLNFSDASFLRLWAENKVSAKGNLKECMLLVDALWRYSQIIGALNVPWWLYRILAKDLYTKELKWTLISL